MALPAVVALIPLFYFVLRNTSCYLGQHLWFGFFAVYSFVMHVVQMPWTTILEDFECHGNITDFCVTACFENIFRVPVTGIWLYFFSVCLGFFVLFETFMAGSQSNNNNNNSNDKLVESVGSDVEVQERAPCSKSSLHYQHKRRDWLFYLFFLLLMMAAQCLLSYFLLYQHLPLLKQSTINCSTDYCLGSYRCLVSGRMEKRKAIYTLIGFSFITILFNLGISLYSTYHYLLKKS